MEPLPYFLFLLSKNILLCNIIMHNSFSQVDLNQIEHITRSEQVINFPNFRLGENENFSSVNIMLMEESTSISFHTTSSEYYDHPERYFERSGIERNSYPYITYGQESRTRKKKLGDFNIFGPGIPPATIYVAQSNIYGYVISINFYKFNLAVPPR